MTKKQKHDVKEAARELYQDRCISLEMAIWAMKNAGYTREETVELLGLNDAVQGRKNIGEEMTMELRR
jgi:hypothetical protein